MSTSIHLLTDVNCRRSSTPGSASYGDHMTPEEVIEFFAPRQSSTDAVMNWLASSGISADRCAPSVNKQVFVYFWIIIGPRH
ncbi:MAG: hypothetical protein CL912_12920 [Deltaproteobacteria bacterium]|nr:hypothetical protein [Deltaproteobacteria bacterium]